MMKNKISIFTLAAMSAASVLNATDYYYTLDGSYYGTTAPTTGDYKTITVDEDDEVEYRYQVNSSGSATGTIRTATYGGTTVEYSYITLAGFKEVESMTNYNAIGLSMVSNTGGGALLLQRNLDVLTGTFIGNTTDATNGGGAIFTSDSVTSTVVTAAFLNNSATGTYNGGGSGGAVYNNKGTLTLAGVFIANTANDEGGAIYNITAGTTNITTSSTYGDTVFSGNTANGVSNAIHNLGTMNFSSTGDYKVIVNDGISGSSSAYGTMNITSGTTVFNNTVSNQTIAVSSGATLQLGSTTVTGKSYTANLSASSLTVSGTLSLALSDAGTIELCDVTFNSGSALVLDMSDIFGDFSLDITIASGSVLETFTVYLDDGSSESINLADGDYDLSSDYYSALSITSSGTTYTITGTAVPEPSTYAMIFGVVALGFAAYRRRK